MKIIAHRGASGYAPENTLAAFKLALEQKCDGLEFDVQMTKDEEIIICHDYRVDRTTNGTGHIKDLTLSELKTLDAGSWFDKKFTGEKIPTLEEVFEIVPPGILMNIEIKNLAKERRDIEQKVVDLVLKHNRMDDVIISSFDHLSLKTVREINKDIKIGFLIYSYLLEPWTYFKKCGIDAYSIHPAEEYLNEDFVLNAHKNNYKILCYTVNDKNTATTMDKMGVDAIISNYPDILAK
ncbi:glycerophosphodiester phosphodiesterase [Mycoplasmatota bacterium]|nr:glycerophosphodiester phosphodiesterase [Mycoplasmatota bacterium]